MIQEQVEELQRSVDAFARSAGALSPEAFRAPLGRWTPRDVVAHLVGWNRYVVEGGRQILKGELPFYDVDPGENYANVNAVIVREIASNDREELLTELRASAAELAVFLRSLDERAWDADFGVRHRGETVTVESTVDDLIVDYAHHREQLEALAR